LTPSRPGGLAANPFAAVDDFSAMKAELRWLNPENRKIYVDYVKRRIEYIAGKNFDSYYKTARKPIDRRRWEFLMQRKAWFIMPLGWDRIADGGGTVIDLGCGDGDTVQRPDRLHQCALEGARRNGAHAAHRGA
jgi:hypothetical protein